MPVAVRALTGSFRLDCQFLAFALAIQYVMVLSVYAFAAFSDRYRWQHRRIVSNRQADRDRPDSPGGSTGFTPAWHHGYRPEFVGLCCSL